MALQDLASNLKLLCGYGKSITEICNSSGINRQQFNKYLSGQTQPSLQTLRKICDFFGVEDHEIFLDHRTFAALIKVRPPKLGQVPDPLYDFVDKIARIDITRQKELDKYIGFYHTFFQPDGQSGEILCNLYSIYKRDNAYYTKQIERHPDGTYMLPKVLKYTGIMLSVGDRLVFHEHEDLTGKSAWNTILYKSNYDTPSTLTGLTTGITPESAHTVQSYRVLFQYLGHTPNIRDVIGKCGVYSPNHPIITDYIRYCVNNTMLEGEISFSPRF